MEQKKPIEIIRDLTEINMELFSVSDKLKDYELDFGLAHQYIRDATMEIQKVAGNLCVKAEENGHG